MLKPTQTTKSRVEQTYTEIKRRILNNIYTPGYQVLEQDIAADLCVSRTPVREAFIRLEADGLVDLMARKGMRVKALTPQHMKEIYEVLTAVETMAVELLAKRKPNAKELNKLETHLKQMDDALIQGDLDAWAESDDSFHKELLNSCGNQRLATIAQTIRDQGHRARLITLRLRPKPTLSNDEHTAVFKAIQNGDWETARDLHYSHRCRTCEELVQILEHFKLPNL